MDYNEFVEKVKNSKLTNKEKIELMENIKNDKDFFKSLSEYQEKILIKHGLMQ